MSPPGLAPTRYLLHERHGKMGRGHLRTPASSKRTSPALTSPHPAHGHLLPLCHFVCPSFQKHKGGWNLEARCQEVHTYLQNHRC